MTLDYAIITGYLLVILLVGLLSGRGMKTLADFSVFHRSYGSLVLFATLSASFIGGGFSIGNAEKVFRFGIANIVALWGFSLKEILVATFIAPRTGNFSGVISVGDLMDRGYGRMGRIVSGFFSVNGNLVSAGLSLQAVPICSLYAFNSASLDLKAL